MKIECVAAFPGVPTIMEVKMFDDILWWGYRHTDGGLQAKRFFDQRDIDEARESPFCAVIVGPFQANSREDALEKIRCKI